ncbi:MAG TPA: endonuclease/exonuclease/phosphatase family protein [Blastocatellia bacterium]|nr:endonuclease/exonuclease/phosphatase family protein [Blastocatellia bacterium]
MKKQILLIAVVMAAIAAVWSLKTNAAFQASLTVISWNVESGDSNPTVLAQRIANVNGADIWGFSEVDANTMPAVFETAAENGEGANFRRILGTTGAADRLMIIYDADRFILISSQELNEINVTGTVRAPLVARLQDRLSGKEFLFMVNHLYRSSTSGRLQQARLLNQWGRAQTLPVIAVGDYNFDYAVTGGDTNHDQGYDLLVANGVYRWVRPATLRGTQCSEGVTNPTSVLDFIFTVGAAQRWPGTSTILTVANDCPDSGTQTSDHRMVRGVFTLTP